MEDNQNSYVRTEVQSSNPKAKTLQESGQHTNQQHRNDPLKVTQWKKNEINWTPS
jgi:hypothetical protein